VGVDVLPSSFSINKSIKELDNEIEQSHQESVKKNIHNK
jgi:hypothetical protein